MARQRRALRPQPPLPSRSGIRPTVIAVPADIAGRTAIDILTSLYPESAGDAARKFHAGDVVDGDGSVIGPEKVMDAGARLHVFRDLPIEATIPFELTILHQDERLVVVDKPHFLATTPRGKHVTQTALIRLRQALDLPDLSPAHRLDRLTSGVLVFTTERHLRHAYQTLFASRAVHKRYEAVAPTTHTLTFPLEHRARIFKEHGTLQGWHTGGEPNSHTRIDVLRSDGDLSLYQLEPTTGRTHQLRLHMCGLGIPILHDPLYPEVRRDLSLPPEKTEAPAEDGWRPDFSAPLQLLARSIEFVDPISGEQRYFESQRELAFAPSVHA